MGCVPTSETHVQNFSKTILTSSNLSIHPSPVVQQKILKSQPDYIELIPLKSRPFCEISLCMQNSSKTERVLKKFSKSIYSDLTVDFSAILKNLEFLVSLDHPNLLKTFEVCQDDHFFYVFSEYFPGTCLFSQLIKTKFIKENQLSDIFYQICKALAFFHEKTGVFRDLHPDSVLLTQKDGKFLVKVADLENSSIFDLRSEKKTVFSTFHFLAPEVLEARSSFKSDSWSVGMMLFVILSGKSPYSGKDSESVLKQLKNSPFRLTPSKYETFSEPVVDFLKKLMKPLPELRSSVGEVLNHPWLSQHLSPDSSYSDESMIHLLDFHIWSQLKSSLNTYISSLIDQNEEIRSLLQCFHSIDTEKSGLIPKARFSSEIKALVKSSLFFDIASRPESMIDDQIDYEKVVFAFASYQRSSSLENLNSEYKAFEFFENSFITSNELRTILKFWTGEGEEVWQELIEEADLEGQVFLKDFLSFMNETPSTLSSLKLVKNLKVEPC